MWQVKIYGKDSCSIRSHVICISCIYMKCVLLVFASFLIPVTSQSETLQFWNDPRDKAHRNTHHLLHTANTRVSWIPVRRMHGSLYHLFRKYIVCLFMQILLISSYRLSSVTLPSESLNLLLTDLAGLTSIQTMV